MNKTIILITAILALLVVGGIGIFLATKSTENTTPAINKQATQPTAVPTQDKTKTYSLEEIATHSSESDCWMAINEKVYDVTSFISGHPGGKAIIKGCGKDATTLFMERPTNSKGPHPKQAMELLPKFEIGSLKI